MEIDVDGKACAFVQTGGTADRWTCGESELDLGALGAELRITKDADDAWTVANPPEPIMGAMP